MKFALVFAAAALSMTSCNCFKKMAKHQDEVSLNCTPRVLTLNNGKVAADITVNFPVEYFNPKAVLKVTPVLPLREKRDTFTQIFSPGRCALVCPE